MPLILLNFQGKNCSALNSHLEFLFPQHPIVREILVLHVLILKQTREKLTGNFKTLGRACGVMDSLDRWGVHMTRGCVRWIVIFAGGRGWAVWRPGGWPSGDRRSTAQS